MSTIEFVCFKSFPGIWSNNVYVALTYSTMESNK